MDIERQFMEKCNTYSDIYQHLPILSHYSSQCERIVECGMRSVVSSWAFAHGLLHNSSTVKELISVDLDYSPNMEVLKQSCQKNNINFVFIMANDVKITLQECDLLFIDTWHIYGHLKRELECHADKAKQYIILHDTTVDADVGESIRCGFNVEQQAIESGYDVKEITKGLWPAVEEFLEQHTEWVLEKRYTNNNGLTILKRL